MKRRAHHRRTQERRRTIAGLAAVLGLDRRHTERRTVTRRRTDTQPLAADDRADLDEWNGVGWITDGP